MSLNNLSAYLGNLGRSEDALAAIEEATGIFRDLAMEEATDIRELVTNPFIHLSWVRDSPVYFCRTGLAMSLNNLSNRLTGLGRREDALAAIEEATGIYRELAGTRPDAFNTADRAASLTDLSNTVPARCGRGKGVPSPRNQGEGHGSGVEPGAQP